MREVAIVGAGALGGMLASALAKRDLVSTIRLLDDKHGVAAGVALDLMQTAPIETFATKITGSTDLTIAAGASIVVLADRSDGSEWEPDAALPLIRRIVQPGGATFVLYAGASHRELVERTARELGVSRTRLAGSAPQALAAAVRAMVAVEADRSPSDVALSVLGVPPHRTIVLWDDATIAGIAATKVLDEPARRRLSERIAPLWPPGPYALASAAVDLICALVGASRRIVSCFVAPDDSLGRRARAVALPVRFERGELSDAVLPPLAGKTRTALETAMLL